jgi:MYXO-CTERM domain-containing protein
MLTAMVSGPGPFVFLAMVGLASPALGQVQDVGPRAPPSASASAAPEDCTDWEGHSLGRAGRSKVRLKTCLRGKKVAGRIEFIGDAGGSEREVTGDLLVTGAMVLKDERLIVKHKVPGWIPALIHRYDLGPPAEGRLDGTFDLDYNGWKDHGKIELTKVTANAGAPLPPPLPEPVPVALPLPQPAPAKPDPTLSDHLKCQCASVGGADGPRGGWILGAFVGVAAITRRKQRANGAASAGRGLSEPPRARE